MKQKEKTELENKSVKGKNLTWEKVYRWSAVSEG